MSAWSKEEFEEFCARAGVDPKQVLKSGQVNLESKKHERAKNQASGPPPGVSYAEREQDPDVALEPPVARTQPLVADSGRRPRVHVIIRGLRLRFLDQDNFVGSCKALVDGLVRAGIAPDDSQKEVQAGNLRIDYEQQLVTAYTKECTEIEIAWSVAD